MVPSTPPASNSSAFPPLNLADYEALAQQKLPQAAWEYFSGGSADEFTLHWNRKSLCRLRIKPRVMVDVAQIDTRIELFGQQMAHPILLAPTSTHMLADPEGEVATVRGAGAANAILVTSTMSNRSVEEITRAASGPVWFQLYVDDDRQVTIDLIQRAEAAGCRALCITVDNAVHYARNRQDRAFLESTPQFSFPNLNLTAGPGGVGRKGGRSRKLSWRDLDWIQSLAKAPVLLKGILNPDDADIAAKAGIAGIVVSNHGGRVLDSIPATIEALPSVVDRVAGRVPVLVDGGIRRGTDVLKCLAFGAAAVLIGRPYLYGLSVAGSDGVRDIVDILRIEFERAMALTGRTSIAAIDRTVLWQEKHSRLIE